MTTPAQKPGLHPRNKNAAGYDFAALTAVAPGLVKFVITTKAGTPSIDFANPSAVKAFNRALLALHYGIKGWEIPAGYLCPPIPGRADYITTRPTCSPPATRKQSRPAPACACSTSASAPTASIR